ncbi:unnamed protein product, partial [Psylliodes chrysocephalus]
MSKSSEADPEEGEIIDDDFDEISDNSIILNETGKSLFPKERLPVISLSSVSGDEEEDRKIKRFKKFHGHHHHHHHHRGHHNHHIKIKKKIKDKWFSKYHKKKKWKRLMESSSSSSYSESSLDIELDRKLQNQLKAAIRVQAEEDCTKNSLKSRLRAMTRPVDILEMKIDSPKSDNNEKPIEDKQNIDEIDDELIQLRLEAEHRKKRKVKEMEEKEGKTDNLETNKENTGNENMQTKKICLDEPDVNTTPPDEDEDVLRALLLASMSKKMTKDIVVQKVELPKNIDPKPNQNIAKPNVFVKKSVPLRQHIPSKIKPIIININTDTESEDEGNKTVINPNIKDTVLPINQINSEIENTVERFLKEQRAKVEAQLVANPVIPVTPKSKLIKPQKPNDSVILEKSAVKLLPKVKQIEYQKLLQRLKNAQKKPRIRRASFKGIEEGNSVRKIVRNKIHSPGKSCGVVKNEKVPDIKQDARMLHNALKQMQKQKNGRLQIEEKYVVLTPIIRKINEASTERKKYDQDVKRLLEELTEAKAKLHETHQNFSVCVKELLTKKEEIDKSTPQPAPKKNGLTKIPHTSTPNKIKLPVETFEISTIPNTPNSTLPTTSTPINIAVPKSPITFNPPKSPNKDCEKISEEGCGDDVEKHEILKISELDVICNGNNTENSDLDDINPGDPNDILRIYEKEQIVPKYVSPLDSIKRDAGYDPFEIMCPYDIDGNCRDEECS